MALTRRIDPVEARVVGALMEKEQTTPASYPLTVNQLLLACNQRSNRHPVTDFGEQEVRDALNSLRKDVLVWRVDGARVERWEHRLTGRWRLDPPAKAILTLLLLRGPQTPGELRSRSERMHSFGAVSEVEEKLRELASGDDHLVRELPREPGQRENRWRHVMLNQEEESDAVVATEGVGSAAVTEAAPSSAIAETPPVQHGFDSRAELEERLERLARKVVELERRLERLEMT